MFVGRMQKYQRLQKSVFNNMPNIQNGRVLFSKTSNNFLNLVAASVIPYIL